MENATHQVSVPCQTSGEVPTSKVDHTDSEFEFGSLTPTSPSKDPDSTNSPADRLFLNGRLLPHKFPSSQPLALSKHIIRNTAGSTGRSSSVNSSSCSTSTNHTPRTSSSSSSNSTSSNNTSSTDDARFFYRRDTNAAKFVYSSTSSKKKATDMVTAQLYGSYSRRWQYITPVPGTTFKREGSVKKKSSGNVNGSKNGCGRPKHRKNNQNCNSNNNHRLVRWWRRLVRAVLMACQECHAMEPSKSRDHDDVVQAKSVIAS